MPKLISPFSYLSIWKDRRLYQSRSIDKMLVGSRIKFDRALNELFCFKKTELSSVLESNGEISRILSDLTVGNKFS